MRIALLALISFLPGVLSAQSSSKRLSESVLHFEDFRVPSPIARRKDRAVIGRPRVPQETPEQFQQRLVKEAKKGPDFAAFYTVIIWSCGSPCANAALVDVRTGESFHLPFAGVVGWGNCEGSPDSGGDLLSYKLDSSLLIVTGSLEIPNLKDHTLHEGPCRRFYYQWDGHRLNLLRTVIPIQAKPLK